MLDFRFRAGRPFWSAGVKTYRGLREPVCHVRVLGDAGGGAAPAPPVPAPAPPAVTPLPGRELVVPRELVPHAQVFFDWGADGPGTHYLAVALLADLLGTANRAAIKAALPFLRRFLSKLPTDDFEISETVFRAFVHALGAAAAAPAAPRALPGGHTGPDAGHYGRRNGADQTGAPAHRFGAEGNGNGR